MKLFLPERSVRFKDGWKALAKAARAKWRQSFSPTMTEVHAHELQTRRFEVVLEFLKEDLIQIFGRGWNQTDKLPTVWRDRFEPYRERLAEAEACADKIEAISAFRFNLCFENVEYPGYVTEKIIDCFVGGTIPVYWGAPDADEIIPRAAYIDGREYSGDWAALRNRLQSMGEGEATGMIEAGRRFLREPGGLCFSHEAFAAKVSGLLRKRIGEGAPA
jgi:hypothetical protein